MKRFRFILACLLVVVASGCGYHLAGLGSSLPEYMHKIYVPVFMNRSYEYGLENVLTQELIKAFNRRAQINTVKEIKEADAVLEGEIVDYKYVPTLNAQRKVTQYYIHITASVRLKDLVNNRIFWEDKGFVFHQLYNVTSDLASTQANREKAWQEAAEDFADSLASVLLEGF